ncbi:MAG: hypothetical protein COB04_03330 [Gammaproteobacteria bacterium]|nr:MAG: hypothetical protein COB04_03330 [Gammaproteobacteria bacterium]
MKFPFDPQFPAKSADNQHLHELDKMPVKPIFIMGLHRSGTTFLYDSISKCFPVANLSLYHIFYYHRLMTNHKEGHETRDRETLNRLFKSLDITDRKIDAVEVNDEMVEEYGWMLRNESYHISAHETNKDYLKQICQKLLYVHPGSKAVLLKNPWDTAKASDILKWFPDAKFIYITRDPIYILNSQINAGLDLMTGDQPFQTMLIDEFKAPGGKATMSVVYAAWKLIRGLKQIVGNGIYGFVLNKLVKQTLKSDLAGYYQAIEELPSESVFQLTYGGFNKDPVGKLEAIQKFLDLPFDESPESIKPKPRKGHLADHLKRQEPQLMQTLEKKLGHSAVVES